VSNPTVIFADEPTGNLDSASGQEILMLLRRAVDEGGRTVVMVTHDPAAASIADRVVLLSDGHVVLDREGMDADEVFDAVRGLDRA
jgi:putative ABC transport system ATP-binding protein